MSHYAEIELKLKGDAEILVRALMEMECSLGKLTRSDILVNEARVSLYGYHGDVRPQKAHIVIPGSGHPSRNNRVGIASNDIGFERKADGTWTAHISQNESYYYNDDWQKRLLSKWAVQNIGLQAEKQGKRWEVAYKTEENKTFAYVRVQGY